MNESLPIFVYGTLKRGHERADLWPHEPLRVTPATTRGCLFDLGPYPAMIQGDDLVAGELWQFSYRHVERVLQVLDRIEGADLGGIDLYRRCRIDALSVENELRTAHAYLYADEMKLAKANRLRPNERGWCEWVRVNHM